MTDSVGEAAKPLWGSFTTLALQNSPSSGLRLRDFPHFIRAWGEVKLAAAQVNSGLGVIDSERAAAIDDAATEVARGDLIAHFPLRVVSTGNVTATNMNVNEVIATRATELTGNRITITTDHVNRSQSSNDTYPTAVKIMFVRQALEAASALRKLASSFTRQAERHVGVQRMGRTAWQDAVVVPVSATHRAHAAAAERFAAQFENAAETLQAVQLGGTVLGTGVGAPKGFGSAAIAKLAEITGLQLRQSADLVDALAHADGYALLADTTARCASILFKQSQDLKILSSGPNGGLSELSLMELQPGSSIMPGKVNPVIPTLVIQASFSIRGAATAVRLAVASGDPDGNGNTPAIVAALSPALIELASVVSILADKCVDGLRWNQERLAELASRPFDSVIAQAQTDGYDTVAGHPSP